MNIEERLKFYSDNYTVPFQCSISSGKKILIGDREKKRCRFCGLNSLEITFRNTSHAIPEFLGNKQIILADECDSCNDFFSINLENHLDKFTKPYRLIAKIKGKDKVPSYKTKDKKSRMDFDNGKGFVLKEMVDSRFSELSLEDKKLTLPYVREPYIPTAVYKCFVKIALSLIDYNDMNNFKETVKWILNSDHSKKMFTPQIVKWCFIPGFNPNKKLNITLLKLKDGVLNLPHCYLTIGFGNLVYQLIIPSEKDRSESGAVSFQMPFFPTPFDLNNEGKMIYWTLDLTKHEIVKDEKETVDIVFENITKVG